MRPNGFRSPHREPRGVPRGGPGPGQSLQRAPSPGHRRGRHLRSDERHLLPLPRDRQTLRKHFLTSRASLHQAANNLYRCRVCTPSILRHLSYRVTVRENIVYALLNPWYNHESDIRSESITLHGLDRTTHLPVLRCGLIRIFFRDEPDSPDENDDHG